MRVRILGCSGGETPGFGLTSFLIDRNLLVDAGSATSMLSQDEQAAVDHILVSHSHLDHVKDIAFLADNLLGRRRTAVTVYSHAEVLSAIRKHLLNDAIWPDFTKIPKPDNPILRFQEIQPERPFKLDGYTIQAVEVNHLVPCVGYLIDDGRASFLYTGDTGPTDRIWEIANATENLKAVVIDVSFSREQHEIAVLSKHLSTAMLEGELRKLRRDVPVYLYHSKAGNLETIRKEIAELSLRGPVQLMRGDVITV